MNNNRVGYFAPLLAVATAMLVAGCVGESGSDSGVGAPVATQLSPAAELGNKIFHDVSLSASGKQSCATCHAPDNAHVAGDGRAVAMGGPSNDLSGIRNIPTLRYLKFNSGFTFAADGTPTGGFMLDGRKASLAEQAQGPFITDFEMANADAAAVVDKLKRAAYAEQFRAVFGADIFDNPDKAFERMAFALQRFQQEDPAFAPFDSKYDYFLAGKVRLSDQELRGLALFNDPNKGNCAACHTSARGKDGMPPLFTDFTYDNLGVPRNPDIPANRDPAYFDLGLCGPKREDLRARADLCGAFKVPTLRNVAKTAPYFHNGRFQTLREVVEFYVRRDTNPEQFYPLNPDGTINKFDDLPPQYRGNVNTTEVPYNRKPGDMPALTAEEIDSVVAFLNTLTDGYQPAGK